MLIYGGKRPAVETTTYQGLSIDDYVAFLRSRQNYTATPIYIEATGDYSYRMDSPIVAATSLCAPPSVDGGADNPSPNALIRDRYIGLRVTAAGNLILTSGTSTGTLAVNALDRALPRGFVLTFSGGIIQLRAAAAAGATSLDVARIYTDVTITTSQVGTPTNGFFAQGGTTRARLANLCLAGDPNPLIARGYDAGRKYACDGIAVTGIGCRYENLVISNFPGHGIYATYPVNSSTLYGVTTPWDSTEVYFRDLTVTKCFSGITIGATDCVADALLVSECRDYGVRFMGFAAQVGRVHAYGCGKGIWASGNVYADQLEGETCDYGVVLAGGSDRSQIGSVRSFDNAYVGLSLAVGNGWIGSAIVDHRTNTPDGNAPSADLPGTGYAVVLGSWADYFTITHLRITCFDAAQGLLLGHSAGKTLTGLDLRGTVSGVTGTYGVHVPYPLAGSNLELVVAGFTTGVYFGDDCALTGNRLVFRGPAATTIRWPDGTTGTFATPNIPTAIAIGNDFQTLTF